MTRQGQHRAVRLATQLPFPNSATFPSLPPPSPAPSPAFFCLPGEGSANVFTECALIKSLRSKVESSGGSKNQNAA